MKDLRFYTTNELKPSGWLRRQLEIQARGLSGNLDLVWRDVRDSAWIGGDAEGWERVPYWLDGFIPLAYLLEDEDLIGRAKKYIDAIIASQKESGWICPCPEEEASGYDPWALLLISKVLVVWYQCSQDKRTPVVLYRAMKNFYELLSEGKIKLFNWGKYRWFEGFIAIDLLLRLYGEEWILDLARILKEQGADYRAAAYLWERPLNAWKYDTHIVNLAMMLKSEAISHQILGSEYTDEAEALRAILKKYNSTPVEAFTGDECLSGNSPIQGTELCAITEQMYSYEWLYARTGDTKWAERLEILAFNALPATISDDMWTHQYVQMANQICCRRFPGKPIFRTNNREAHLFGLEPNYGCCTANFNQGWPKLALSTFFKSEDGIVCALPLPSVLRDNGTEIEVVSDYPFNNGFEFRINTDRSFTLGVRIPSFARDLAVDGRPASANSNMLSFAIQAGASVTLHISFDVIPEFIERNYGLRTVRVGSLVFSLPIEYEKVMYEYEKNGVERKYPYCDYEYIGKSDWNYAFTKDAALRITRGEVGDVPFSSYCPPVTVTTEAVKIDWGFEDGYDSVCAKLPASRAPLGKAEAVTLYPYGCAKLRMTELPESD